MKITFNEYQITFILLAVIFCFVFSSYVFGVGALGTALALRK